MEGNPAADPGFNPDAVVRLPVQYWTFTMSNSKESCRSCFPLAVWRRGRDPPPVYLNRSSPCSGLSALATDAHMPHQLPRRNDGAAAVRVALVRSERIAVLIKSRSI